MKDASPKTIFLSEYRPFGYIVDDVDLTFRLSARATRVVSKISFTPNADFPGEFFLHGQEVKLIWAKIDGVDVTPVVTDDGLTCDVPDAPFVWEAEVEIPPLRGFICPTACIAPSARPRGFARSHSTPTALM